MITSDTTKVNAAELAGRKVQVTLKGKTRRATVEGVAGNRITLLMADTGRMLRIPVNHPMEMGW